MKSILERSAEKREESGSKEEDPTPYDPNLFVVRGEGETQTNK
jgi:hypothetical protein